MLPENTSLGELELVEFYEFYDIPAIFLAKNFDEQYYFVLWMENQPNENIWLYIPLVDEEVAELRLGNVSFRDIILLNSAQKAHVVIITEQETDIPEGFEGIVESAHTTLTEVRTYSINRLPTEFIPEDDYYVESITTKEQNAEWFK